MPPRPDIVLVPVGPVSADLLVWLEVRMTRTLNLNTAAGAGLPLPDGGYDAGRGQYRAEAVMAALKAGAPRDVGRVMGLIDADCFSPRLNFIFGQAMSGGRVAFVALPRLRPTFYGLPPDEQLFRERVLKEMIHELGHTWGLAHCADSRCIMFFSNTLADTDVKGPGFCPHCRVRLGAR